MQRAKKRKEEEGEGREGKGKRGGGRTRRRGSEGARGSEGRRGGRREGGRDHATFIQLLSNLTFCVLLAGCGLRSSEPSRAVRRR
jgi:hypothetical protein